MFMFKSLIAYDCSMCDYSGQQCCVKGTLISYDALVGWGLLKPSECRHMGRGIWPNRHLTFIVAEEA